MCYFRKMLKTGGGIFMCLLAMGGLAEDNNQTSAELYQAYCSVCHGERGDGRSRAQRGLVPPPRDFTSDGLALNLTREVMVNIVLHGKPGTAMAAWKSRLSAREAEGIVDYIRQEFMQLAEALDIQGAQLYLDNCAVCHGDKGAGSVWASSSMKPPPRDFSTAVLSRQRMLASVSQGRPGTPMPAFASQLSQQAIERVVDFIRTEMMPNTTARDPLETVRPGAGSTGSMPAPERVDLQGDYASGEAFYLANCATCHGVNGDGNGPRAYFIFPKPRNFITVTGRERFDREVLFNAIKFGVRGKEMPAWGKVLNDQQIANVAEYVLQKFIRQDSGS